MTDAAWQPVLPPGVRMTAQRRAVFDLVARTDGAFTVAELHDRARAVSPRLGLATVYRTVELLHGTGSLRTLHRDGQTTYVRCAPDHHHHLVCVTCGNVQETALCAAPSDALLRRRHGFRAHSHELEIYGTCAACAA